MCKKRFLVYYDLDQALTQDYTNIFKGGRLASHPYPTVDIIIECEGKIVLIQRKYEPLGWAIPGGFVDYGETLEEAAIREAKEETSLEVKLLHQFKT